MPKADKHPKKTGNKIIWFCMYTGATITLFSFLLAMFTELNIFRNITFIGLALMCGGGLFTRGSAKC